MSNLNKDMDKIHTEVQSQLQIVVEKTSSAKDLFLSNLPIENKRTNNVVICPSDSSDSSP